MTDPRLADVIVNYEPSQAYNIVVVGFPNDEGVARNGGRIGAAKAPASFRKFMGRLCASDSRLGVDLRKIKIADAGDVEESKLEEAHEALAQKVYNTLKVNKAIPFVVGGGNDQSYANVSGLLKFLDELPTKSSVMVINLDAHLDVRPLKNNQVHSGSPFRLMLEDPRFKKHSGSFVEFAAQGAQCSLEHAEYVQQNNGQIMWAAEMEDPVMMFETLLETCASDHIFVSFDLDCVRSCDAPGVSAPSPLGITARDAVRICYLAGKCSKVKLCDLSEFNPVVEEYMTGKLVGMMFHSFACGLAERH